MNGMLGRIRRWAVLPWAMVSVFVVIGDIAKGETTIADIVTFDAKNGSIRELKGASGGPSIAHSGEFGLWQVRFQDGHSVDASAFSVGSPDHSLRIEKDAAGSVSKLIFTSDELTVEVVPKAVPDGVQFIGRVTPRQGTVLGVSLPARLRFAAKDVEKFVCPANGNMSVGTAFRRGFFEPSPPDKPAGWQSETLGGKGYTMLLGGGPDMRPVRDDPVALNATPEGRTWLGSLAERIPNQKAVVNRAPGSGQADLVLVNSAHGPYFSARSFGKSGRLWRIGGMVRDEDADLVLDLVTAAIEHLASDNPPKRTQLGVLSLLHGPPQGSWAAVRVEDWLARLKRLPAVASHHIELVPIATVPQLDAAARADALVAILNPYGELLPMNRDEGPDRAIARIRDYVTKGGNWFEVGGYSFHSALRPRAFVEPYRTPYPPAFADFLHLQGESGSFAVFRVQLRPWGPWQAEHDPTAIFSPGDLACGGDEQGGWCERSYGAFVPAGQTWQAPTTRLVVGISAPDALHTYARLNGLTRPLADKLPARLRDVFPNAVMVFLGGNAREKLAHLDQLPKPALIHFSDYLHGGFDKQYPDHLPPNPSFGTPAEFRTLYDRAHQLGHLVMPYTNPTWWCDGPPGPTFEKYGQAPLLKGLDGKPVREQYSKNFGWTITFWHPAVQEANRRTRTLFTEQYPSDVLFQDQCGARHWSFDTNPASPAPDAYVEGLLSMVDEDAHVVPLSTEAGWDRVAQFEAQLCGMSFQLVPTAHAPEWRRLMKELYDPSTWEVFPVAEYLAHDQVSMLHHDLGQFVTNQQVLAWTLGLGFGLSDRVAASQLSEDGPHEWLLWLARIQKSVCSRYVGVALSDFQHDRGANPTTVDDGVIRTRYGDLQIVANLGPIERTEAKFQLAPFGFLATAKGMIAAHVARLGGLDFGPNGFSFVTQSAPGGSDIWAYSPGGQEVAVALADGAPALATTTLTFDHGEKVTAVAADHALRFRLPVSARDRSISPPPELASKAPKDWPGPRPALGVIDLGAAVVPTWADVNVDRWVQELNNSSLVKTHHLEVKKITAPKELAAALQAGPTHYLALINPYGERFPVAGVGQWRSQLDLVRGYVEHGGSWWETGGHSFHQATWLEGSHVKTEPVEGQGLRALGLPIGGGEVDQLPEPLHVPSEARSWIGSSLADQLERLESAVNRGLPREPGSPPHLALVSGRDSDFIGGYRLDGWGWLWRIGGLHPNPDVAVPVVIAALEHLYTAPPAPRPLGGTRYLWHARMSDPAAPGVGGTK